MRSIVYFLIFFLAPHLVYCQVHSFEIPKDCNEKVFTKVEVLPDFKNGKAAFEDSISNYLSKNNIGLVDGKAIFTFIVTIDSKVVQAQKIAGGMPNYQKILDAISLLPDLWIPATQNNHIVCAFVKLEVNVSEKKISVRRF